jgi:bifunctional DNA-binding transcriptional regulator/antitoxin component of YhaV-PrlF toxin-antitoxin module
MAGLAEDAAPFGQPRPGLRLKVGADGRVLIASELRKAAGFAPGSSADAEAVDGEARLVPFAERLRRVQALPAPLRRPGERIVDELIAARRAEAMREDHGE